MLFTAATAPICIKVRYIARVAVKSVLRALDKLLKNEVEHNMKNKSLK
ncbi:hypothetical protein T09_8204 [Trichinella sp. T9]|nr:hypothetical protein T09_8204 [Trichinella sp. T9]